MIRSVPRSLALGAGALAVALTGMVPAAGGAKGASTGARSAAAAPPAAAARSTAAAPPAAAARSAAGSPAAAARSTGAPAATGTPPSPAAPPAASAGGSGGSASPPTAAGGNSLRPPGRRGGTIVVPDHFLRRWDPVTVFFDHDLGPARGGPEDNPGRFVKTAPHHPGAFRWLNARTLQFTPAEPWPPLARFTWTAGGVTARLDTLMSPPVSTLPAAGAEGLDPVRTITLVFAEPLDTQTLAHMLTVELRPLPGASDESGAAPDLGGGAAGDAGASPHTLTAQDFQIKAQERGRRSDPAAYVVTLARPVPLGVRAVLHFRLSLAEETPEAALDLAFSTAERFRVVALGCAGAQAPVASAGTRYSREQALRCTREGRQLSVELSAPLAAGLSPIAARNLIRLEPAVPGLQFSVAGRELLVSGDFHRDTLYRVRLAPAPDITDVKGRHLEVRGTTELFVTFPQLAGFLRWTASQGIVERFGPRMLPLEGRGFERVDLRVYPIDPLDRSFWPFPDAPVGIDEAQRPPGPGEEPEPWQTAGQAVTAAQIARHLKALGSPPVSDLVALPLRRAGGTARFGLDLAPHLAHISGANAPGTYVVGIRRLDASRRLYMRLQVTDLALTAVEEPAAVEFAVTSLATAAPVPGATVRVEGSQSAGGAADKARWTTLFEGTTGANGRVRWTAPGAGDVRRQVTVQRIVARLGADVLVLDPSHPPDGFSDDRWRPRHDTWLDWTQSSLDGRGAAPEDLCHIFTDRPVYRPEETVYVKGYLRRRERGHLTPLTDPGTVEVSGPGDLVWKLPVTVTRSGSFYHSFKQDKLPTGVYSATFKDGEDHALGKVSFRMEAYRLPKFEVQLHSADTVPLDREFKVNLTAAYYAGGRVTARPLAWRVTQFPYSWTPAPHLSGYLYSSDGRYSIAGRFESSPRLTRQDTTDANGAADLVLNPATEPTAQPRTYVVEATVTGADDQTVTATRAVVALPPFVLGLKVPRYVERATRIEPSMVVVGPDNKPLAGQAVTVRLLQRQWHSHLQASDFSDGVARYRTDVVDEKVSETKVTSGAAPLTVPLSLPRSGVYVVELSARDRLGRTQVVAVDLYAGGEQAVSWAKPPAGAFQVVADKSEYRPGETADLVLESPFQHGRALAVVEAPQGNAYDWVAVEGGAATFKVPILGSYTPRVAVHFMLERGRVAGTAPQPGSAADLGRPATVAATTWLKVAPLDNRLDVKLAYPEKARPGQTIEIKIAVADPQGHPQPGEATLWLVDQAVLALGREQRLDPLPDFITAVTSHLTIGDSRNLAFGFLPYAENPGGEIGGGSQGGLLDRVTVRRNFKPVPYFNPAIEIGADGIAKVAVELPDDLTNFKIRAKVASGAERFGFATGEIAVRLPVLVQPALPRFVRPGDRFKAAAVARVVEGEGGAGVAEMRAQGVTVAGAKRQDIRWSAKEASRIEFPVTVDTPGFKADGTPASAEVTLRFAAERSADHAADAAEIKLPVRDDRRRVAVRLQQDLLGGGAMQVPALPEPARPGTVRRSVLASGEPALVRMAAGLDFLLDYPYGCTEQRLSRARAELALGRLRDLLHESGDDARLRRDVTDTLDWIGRAVDGDGLVAYWPGSSGYVSLSAWSLEFMVEARAAGYTVNAKLWATLTRSLEQSLRTDYGHFIDGEAFAERSWALAALAAAGEEQPAYAAELARKTQFLDLEGVSQVLLAFDGQAAASGTRKDKRGAAASAAAGDAAPTADALAHRLWNGIVFKLYGGHQVYGGLQGAGGPALAGNGLILPGETRTLAEATRALARHDGADGRLPLLVDALTTLGGGDGWGSTNANAEALLALTELVRPPFAGARPHTLRVTLGARDQTLTLGPQAPVANLVSTADDAGAAGTVSLAAAAAGDKDAPTQPVAVRVETSYMPATPGDRVEPAAAGLVVSRELLEYHDTGAPPDKLPLTHGGTALQFAVGEVIEEHVRVVNPKERHYVAVAVPLAAGLEPLNPSLATAPPEARPHGALTLAPTYAAYLDDEVTFYYDTLPAGTYDFYFRTRATTEGSFLQPAARAEAMYDATVHGNSAGARVEVARGAAAPRAPGATGASNATGAAGARRKPPARR